MSTVRVFYLFFVPIIETHLFEIQPLALFRGVLRKDDVCAWGHSSPTMSALFHQVHQSPYPQLLFQATFALSLYMSCYSIFKSWQMTSFL